MKNDLEYTIKKTRENLIKMGKLKTFQIFSSKVQNNFRDAVEKTQL